MNQKIPKYHYGSDFGGYDPDIDEEIKDNEEDDEVD